MLWKANEMRSKCKHLLPDILTYNSIIFGHLSDLKNHGGLERMLQIIDYMKKNKCEQLAIAPNCFTYHCVLRAWEQSDKAEAGMRCFETIRTMHDLWEKGDESLQPKSLFYNMAINKLAKTREKNPSRQALKVFNLLRASRWCSPDIISYTSLIECYSKSNHQSAAVKSLELFNEVWQLYEERQDPELMPNLRTYTMTILSLAKRPNLDKVIKARNLLTQLEERYKKTNDPKLKPNAYPYNYVLNCAGSCIGPSGEKLKAFRVAAETYNSLKKSHDTQPDSYTYSFWIKCCNNLLPEGDLRKKGVTLSFDQCQKDGLVSQAVLRRLLSDTPIDVLGQILGSTASYRNHTLAEIPHQWSRNAR